MGGPKSMFSYQEMKYAFIVFVLGGIGLVGLLVPLNQLLPDFFDSWVPDFLENTSIINYLHIHLNFLIEIVVAVGLLAFILYLWRKK
jgi:hypothetical protein